MLRPAHGPDVDCAGLSLSLTSSPSARSARSSRGLRAVSVGDAGHAWALPYLWETRGDRPEVAHGARASRSSPSIAGSRCTRSPPLVEHDAGCDRQQRALRHLDAEPAQSGLRVLGLMMPARDRTSSPLLPRHSLGLNRHGGSAREYEAGPRRRHRGTANPEPSRWPRRVCAASWARCLSAASPGGSAIR